MSSAEVKRMIQSAECQTTRKSFKSKSQEAQMDIDSIEKRQQEPWFHLGDFPPLGDGFIDISWAEQALGQLAFVTGTPRRRVQVKGSLREGTYEDLISSYLGPSSGPGYFLRTLADDKPAKPSEDRRGFYFSDRVAVQTYYDGDLYVTVDVVSTDQGFLDKTIEFFQARLSNEPPPGQVHVVISGQDGPTLMSMGMAGITLERNNYAPEVLMDYDRIVADLRSRTPGGRVAIFDGEPGTGKTYLVRGLLDEVKEGVFIIVPSNLVANLTQPGMIPALIKVKREKSDTVPMIFIIEDADECLAPRAADNMASITNILNFGDGLLGALLDIRIIATTNAQRHELDPAILRPGRLTALIDVERLNSDQAREIYRRLTGLVPPAPGYFTTSMTLAEVYSLAKNNGWKPPPFRHQLGFGHQGTPD